MRSPPLTRGGFSVGILGLRVSENILGQIAVMRDLAQDLGTAGRSARIGKRASWRCFAVCFSLRRYFPCGPPHRVFPDGSYATCAPVRPRCLVASPGLRWALAIALGAAW